ARAVRPVGSERGLALRAAPLVRRGRCRAIGGGPALRLILGLSRVEALLELLEARPERTRELREPVCAEQDHHDDQNDEQFLRSEPKHVQTSSNTPLERRDLKMGSRRSLPSLRRRIGDSSLEQRASYPCSPHSDYGTAATPGLSSSGCE